MKIDDLINYLDFYSKFVKEPFDLGDNQHTAYCCFHEDINQRSFSFNSKTGQWKCFADCGSGNVFDFAELKSGSKEKSKKIKWIESEAGIKLKLSKTIDSKIYKSFYTTLLNSAGTLEWLRKKRGIDIKTIKKFKLGIKKDRISIPIFNQAGECVNIRLYSQQSKASAKMLNYIEGNGANTIRYGGVRLFPIDNLIGKKSVIITEGEMDCLLLNQLGFNAITGTGGAGTFKAEWLNHFKDKQVYICFDIDPPGKKGAQRVATLLDNYAEWIKIIDLGKVISEPKNADVTDYFVNQNYGANDFKELMTSAKKFKDISKSVKTIRKTGYKKVDLSKASHHANALCHIEVEALVAGKNFPPYEIPNKIKLECDCSYSDKVCPYCPLFQEAEHNKTIKLDEIMDEGSLLNLISISDVALQSNIKKLSKIPGRCDKIQIQSLTYANIEEVSLIPEIDFSDDENYEYVQQVAYHVGHGLNTNRVYKFRGLALPDPRTQQATQIFHEAKPAVDSIDSFKMDAKMKKSLSIFQPKEDTFNGICDAYEKRYEDIEIFSGIYDRMDMALAYDIVYHSALDFIFHNKTEKGWMECLLVGDSGCGKTEMSKAMIRYYRLGEFITGENATVAGLIGGLSQNSKQWILTWGKIPLNNRRLVVIDETSGMSVDDIGLFSGVRSSGIAELTKIRTEKTLAKTRKIWIGNPRKMGNTTRTLMEYPYGCIAVRELIGNLEDIRRFDFVLTAHSGEVSSKIYNINRKVKTPKISSAQMHNLVMWVWSRKKHQISFHKKAIDKILKYAIEMGEEYSSLIPIVEASDQRLKIARGAISVAALMFSCNDNGENIIVKECHVQFFGDWLNKIYAKKSLKYKEWSKKEISKRRLKDEEAVAAVVDDDLANIIMELDTFNQSSLMNVTGWEKGNIQQLLRVLQRNNALKMRGTSYYMKTEAFIDYLNKRKEKGNGTKNDTPF